MEITASEAQESLEQVQDAAERTKKMVAYAGGDTLFIVWGAIWVVGFAATHFLGGLGFHSLRTLAAHSIWSVLIAAGIVISIIVSKRRAPVQSAAGPRIGWFWWLLYGYMCLWVGLLWPFVKVQGAEEWQVFGKHLGAISATVPMFAYVVVGLWLDHFMLWLGLAVTALAVVGLFLIQPYFWLWMAGMGGGTLIATGLLIRNRWR
jgi:hypothetical protein